VCDENENERRADWAQIAVDRFQDECSNPGEPVYEGICDLICNLMHLCDRHELDFNDLLRVAKDHHEAEIEEDGPRLGTGRRRGWLEAARDAAMKTREDDFAYGTVSVSPRGRRNAAKKGTSEVRRGVQGSGK
jgi:hypothetical protein